MKIQTSITPRTDGTVIYETPKGNAIVFKDDGNGVCVADVSDKDDADWLMQFSHCDGYKPKASGKQAAADKADKTSAPE